jgi:hypothetical protein
MSNNAFGASIELEIGPARALARSSEAADAMGRVIRHDGEGLTAVIAGGLLNMNPAVVDMKITPLGSHGCRVEVTGTAKEGLIKQRAGEAAVRRLLAATGFAAPPTSDIANAERSGIPNTPDDTQLRAVSELDVNVRDLDRTSCGRCAKRPRSGPWTGRRCTTRRRTGRRA